MTDDTNFEGAEATPAPPTAPAPAPAPAASTAPTSATAPTAFTAPTPTPIPTSQATTPAAATGRTPPTGPMPSTPPPFTAAAPPAQAPAAAAAPAAPLPEPETARRPHPAQFGTIVWGMLLLALCGFVALTQFGPGVDADRYLWAFIGVIAAGVALVAVGIAAAFRR